MDIMDPESNMWVIFGHLMGLSSALCPNSRVLYGHVSVQAPPRDELWLLNFPLARGLESSLNHFCATFYPWIWIRVLPPAEESGCQAHFPAYTAAAAPQVLRQSQRRQARTRQASQACPYQRPDVIVSRPNSR